MGILTSSLIISLIDQVSGPAQKIAASLHQLNANARALTGAATRIQSTTSALAGMNALSMAMPTALSPKTFGHSMYEWDRTLHQFRAISEVPTNTYKALTAEVLRVSNATGTGSSQLMDAVQGWIEIGGKADAVIPVLERVTTTAQLMKLSVKDSLQESRALLIAFGKDPNDKHNVLDMEDFFVVASKNIPGGGEALLTGLKNFGPVAGAVHMPKEQAGALLQTIVQGGFQAGEAGRALKTFVLRLVTPTKQMMQELAAAGVDMKQLFDLGVGKNDVGSLERRLAGAGMHVDDHIRGLLAQRLDNIDDDTKINDLKRQMSQDLIEAYGVKKGDAQNRGKITAIVDQHFARAIEGINVEGIFGLSGEALSTIGRIAGKDHAAKILEELRNKQRYLDNLAVNMAHEGAVERKSAIRNEGFAFEWDRVTAAWDNFGKSIGGSGVMKDMVAPLHAISGLLVAMQSADPTLMRFAFWTTAAAAALPLLGVYALAAGAGFTALGGIVRGVLAPLTKLTGLVARLAGFGKAAAGATAVVAGATAGLPVAGAAAPGAVAAATGGAAATGSSAVGAAASAAKGAGFLARFFQSPVFKALGGVGALFGLYGIGANVAEKGTVEGAGVGGVGMGLKFLSGPAAKLLGSTAGKLVPGIGQAMMLYGLYEALKTHAAGGTVLDSAKAFFGLNTGVGQGISVGEKLVDKFAAGKSDTPSAGATVAAAGAHVAAGPQAQPASAEAAAAGAGDATSDIDRIRAAADGALAACQSAMDQIRAIAASVDLAGEGERMMHSLAAGIRAGQGAVADAARAVADTAVRNAVRGAFSDGGFN